MKLFFVRHGESEANLLREFSNRGLKHPLTEKGRQQVHALAARFRPGQVSHIYTSPLLRARQTAEILSACLGAAITVTAALREYDVGIYEGTSGPAGWEVYGQVRRDWWPGGRLDSRMEGGESFGDIQARFEPFVRGLVVEKGGTAEELILVGHGGLYVTMLPLVLANVTAEFAAAAPYPNTGYVLAETTPAGLAGRTWCDQAIG